MFIGGGALVATAIRAPRSATSHTPAATVTHVAAPAGNAAATEPDLLKSPGVIYSGAYGWLFPSHPS